jgi:pyridoxamine 5'-phosphate oxidase
MNRDLESMRRTSTGDTLDEATAGDDPFALLERWLEDAARGEDPEPNAMVLATVDAEGTPSARVVLLKGYDQRGLAFYTNLESRKGRAAAEDSRASVVFFWQPLHRQVRVEGYLERVSDEESDAYFATRPRDSQLGAWASPQSDVLKDRAQLETALDDTTARFGDGPIPRPAFWGGLRLVPERFEFWQGRQSRLHDRLAYAGAAGAWSRTRLAP